MTSLIIYLDINSLQNKAVAVVECSTLPSTRYQAVLAESITGNEETGPGGDVRFQRNYRNILLAIDL